MVEEINVYDELAIIFKPVLDNEGNGELVPIDVVQGYFDDEEGVFVDINSYSYPHLLDLSMGRSFASRENIGQLMGQFPNNTLNEIKEMLFNEASSNSYVYGALDEEYVVLVKNKNDENANYKLLLDQESSERLMLFVEDSDILQKYESEFMQDDSEGKEIFSQEKVTTSTLKMNPKNLYEEIKKTVIGQDEAIKKIVTTIWKNQHSDNAKNLIVLGNTGVGKTEIFRQLSEILDIPLLTISIAGMSQTGYVGRGTDEILENLLALTNGNVEDAEHAIVLLDEFDKIADQDKSSSAAVSTAVQNELLKIVEDGTFSIEYGVYKDKKMVNTKNITFIGCGACIDLLTTTKKGQIGFGNEINDSVVANDNITSDDLIKNLGFIPELVGRMGNIVKLNDLGIDELKQIISTSKKSAYNDAIRFFENFNIKIKEENKEEIIEAIAKAALSKNTGARSIAAIVEEMFSDITFNLTSEEYKELVISKETVNNPKKYVLKK